LFEFPDPVNETSARLVAAFVVLEALLFLVVREGWVLIPLTYGFLARVATGPTLSPLGQFVTRVATPRVETLLTQRNSDFRSRLVPGPPKRFAQAIGLGFTASASIAWVLDAPAVAVVLIALLAVAATLEAAFAVCLGCIAYSAIWGCADCNDISDRLRRAVAEAREESPVASAVSDAPAPAMR
jgi:cytochrome c biogenesis protein CcdA